MKTPKLLKLSREVLNTGETKKYNRKKCLKELQQKLKKKGKKLKDKMENEKKDKDLKQIKNELKIVFAQREKIIRALKSLK
jgi:hypothetical protein